MVMTLVVGVNAKDPRTNEFYVALFADSRITGKRGELITDKEKKLFTGSHSNYSLGYAGTTLKNYFIGSLDLPYHNFLNDPKIESKETIEDMLLKMNLDLKSNLGMDNQFLIAIREKEPMLYNLTARGLEVAGAYAAIGSGSSYISSIKKLDLYNSKNGSRIVIPKKELITIGRDILKSAEKCKSVGGRTSIVILNQYNVCIL